MKEKKQVLKGEEGFNSYYSELFGERWNSLKESFFKENQSVEYKVRNAEKSYFLDSASIFAALNLPVKGAKNILDLCAAPGGKTLVLASRMDEDAQLSSNERSSDRKHRLSVVVETCLPEEISERVRVSCSDGSTWCTRQSECFDRILLDAPCSSERHVIQDPKYLNTWSPSRIKTVAMEQWALFSSAYRLLEPDGIMVYSTCALNPVENDEMIEKLIKKFNKDGKSFELLESKIDMNEVTDYANFRIPVIEKTKYGYQILPDTAEGAGPIYFSIVHKIQSIQS
ncbi:MAG: RsmB/NOP family class I SAM-dependent RNA methyltransferase [Treponema sp.]|nr:RsmB/NOP family class I SAM-dependent RNA methyltransferase [Treponema sp.]